MRIAELKAHLSEHLRSVREGETPFKRCEASTQAGEAH